MSHDPNLSDPCYPNVAFIINAVPILQELDKKCLLSTLAWAINFQFKNKNGREDGNTCGVFVLINFMLKLEWLEMFPPCFLALTS